MSQTFRVGLTRDFLKPNGKLDPEELGLEALASAPGVSWEVLARKTAELRPEQIKPYDALLVLGLRLTEASLKGSRKLKIVARFGVGYDAVDVEACTRRGILLTITPDGVRRPVASAALTLVLALAHKLLIKDKLTRAGRWAEKLNHMGTGLTGRTLGVLGLGNIGRELLALARPLGMRQLGHDPYISPADVAATGIEMVGLDMLLRSSDFVCICCALTPETHHLINAERIALMRPTAYLINVARGPIVDQGALLDAIQAGRIAGAGLDVFEHEPIDRADPLLALDNVIVAPHALCWTDECFHGIGASACRGILDVAAGRAPRFVVNRKALDHPRWRAAARRARPGAHSA